LTGGGDLPTPTSIVAPSVLLEEMELKRPTGTQQKPSLLTHPISKATEDSKNAG